MWSYKEYIGFLYLLVVSVLDIRKQRLPLFWLVLGGAMAVLVAAADFWAGKVVLGEVLLGMLPGGFLLVVAILTKKMGCADGLVLLYLGMIAGGRKGLFLLCISLFFGSLFGVFLIALRRGRGKTAFAYLPFLTLAYLCLGMLGR